VKVGGGGHPDKTYVSLVIDGKTICSARGNNTEQLRWVSWPVESLEGKDGRIEILDDATGGWGHVLPEQRCLRGGWPVRHDPQSLARASDVV